MTEMPSLPDSQGGSLKMLYFLCESLHNFNASLTFGLATPIELYTFDRNLPDSQTNPPWKYLEMVGISGMILTKEGIVLELATQFLACHTVGSDVISFVTVRHENFLDFRFFPDPRIFSALKKKKFL